MKLPVRKYETRMPNGLRVIYLHKPGFSRSLFMMGIPAGGMNVEDWKNGKSVQHPRGCAHYLEHQMFRLNGEDVTYALADVQAQTNAFTSYEQTCYYVMTNSDPYPSLGLLLDFVQTLDIDQSTVDKEKGIILSEYAQYDQDPESRLLKEAFRSLYHEHPLREDVLGRPEDIAQMTDADLRSFYHTWYDPSRMVLVGISGQEPVQVFDFVRSHEAQYPSLAAPDEELRRVLPKEPETVCRENFALAMDVDQPYACLAVKLQPGRDPRQIVKDDYMLNFYLSQKFTALNPVFQQWLDDHLIGGSHGAEADITSDHGYILIYGQSEKPQEYLDEMERTLLAKKPLSQEDLEGLLRQEKASSIRLADSFTSLASQVVSGAFDSSDPLEDLDILSSITLEDLEDLIDRLDFSHRAKVMIVPKNAENPAD